MLFVSCLLALDSQGAHGLSGIWVLLYCYCNFIFEYVDPFDHYDVFWFPLMYYEHCYLDTSYLIF